MSRENIMIGFLMMITTAVSCVRQEATFQGKTVVYADGSFSRSGSLAIAPADSAAGTEDSTEADKFLSEHFPVFDSNLFEVHTGFSDGKLTVSWSGLFAYDDLPLADYTHRAGEGSTASNRIALEVKDRWFFKDYRYSEVFSDPVSAEKYFDLVDERLNQASAEILGSPSFKGLREGREAAAIMSDLKKNTGVDLLKAMLENPRKLDSLSDLYESYFIIAGDSLAGLAGVKLSPDSASHLLEIEFGAVWDTLMTEHPDMFGSYGLAEEGHKFRIEVFLPGCVKSGNADSTYRNAGVWYFDNVDFFAGEKSLELAARDWAWGNVTVVVLVLLLILLLILRPIRRKKTQ